jgi:predicted alpha/beta hydrolase
MNHKVSTNARTAETDFSFPALDGYGLAATLRRPAAGDAKAFVLIGAATAVPRQFYGKFASYLAEDGFAVLTFDYRGVGGSRPASLRGFPASMRDWAALDLTAAIDFAAREAQGRPLVLVGHSFGGQALGLVPNNAKVARALLVAAQVGYWRLFPPPESYRVYMKLRVVGPAVAHAFGYLPGWFGIGEDLPKGVFLEWAGWCMNPRYLFDDPALETRKNFPNYHGAMRAIGLADDKWAPPKAVELLLEGYTGTKPEHVTINPRDVGAQKIGHFGFFRAEQRDMLWRGAAEWLAVK